MPITTKSQTVHVDHPLLAECKTCIAESAALAPKIDVPRLRTADSDARKAVQALANAVDRSLLAPYRREEARTRNMRLRGAEDRADERMRSGEVTVGGPVVVARQSLAAEELQRSNDRITDDVANTGAPAVLAAAKAAAIALAALDRAIEVTEAALRLPEELRTTEPARLTPGLIQTSTLRDSARSSDMTVNLQTYEDCVRVHGPDAPPVQKLEYILLPLAQEKIRGGIVPIARSMPANAAGLAEKELRAAYRLAGLIEAARREREPEGLAAAKASRDLLARAHRAAVGRDVRWLSRAEFARLYLNSDATLDAKPYALAPIRSIVRRFLGAKLGERS